MKKAIALGAEKAKIIDTDTLVVEEWVLACAHLDGKQTHHDGHLSINLAILNIVQLPPF